MSLPLLLLTDGRFPAGGYAHSAGLEEAVEDGLPIEGIEAFLTGRLQHVALPEAHLAVAAARAARGDSLAALLVLDAEAEARCPSAPLRIVARRLGAQLLRTAAVVWPEADLLARYADASLATPRSVAFGVVAAVAGLDARATAEAYLYEDAMTVVTAAVRLLPVDSAETARWIIAAEPLVQRLAGEAALASDAPRALPGSFAPALELRSVRHAAREGRLFAS